MIKKIANSNKKTKSSFVTALDDFEVNLIDFKLEQVPLYEFVLNGDLLLNGTVDQPSNIQPKGTLTLEQGRVDWLSSSFDLNRRRENKIVFTPEAGMLNPALDIQLNTEINEFNESDIRLAESGENEISEPISQINNGDLITVNLTIDGEAAEILPDLAERTDNCRIRPSGTSLVSANRYYTEAELNRLTNCFNAGALVDESDLLLIDTPAVELTSTPNRSQGEIISLFGTQFLSFAERLKNSSQSELFDLGANQFIIDPVRRRVFSTVDDKVVSAGKSIGLDYLRLYPRLEGIYEINRNSSVRSTYNYGFQDSHEVRLEYQRRF